MFTAKVANKETIVVVAAPITDQPEVSMVVFKSSTLDKTFSNS
jgi:hypothetical protein